MPAVTGGGGEPQAIEDRCGPDPEKSGTFAANCRPAIGHTRLSHTFQGRRFRLTDVHGRIVKDLLACSGGRIGPGGPGTRHDARLRVG